ncbi:7845_t:CDS:2 [Entrophospora sp. SA101]|nr:7838_t:CDS:2 [Entrophospora sp. SA101]CAJ0906361.1 7845_t:CDS:2 [Entrophospora sp. SA101]
MNNELVKFGLILQSLAMRPLINKKELNDENEDNELSEVEGNLNNEIREGDEESDNGSNESDTIIELYELDGYEND